MCSKGIAVSAEGQLDCEQDQSSLAADWNVVWWYYQYLVLQLKAMAVPSWFLQSWSLWWWGEAGCFCFAELEWPLFPMHSPLEGHEDWDLPACLGAKLATVIQVLTWSPTLGCHTDLVALEDVPWCGLSRSHWHPQPFIGSTTELLASYIGRGGGGGWGTKEGRSYQGAQRKVIRSWHHAVLEHSAHLQHQHPRLGCAV